LNDLWLPVILTALSGYLLGSVNSAVIVSHALEQDDIRTHGSGNAGMTNMYRVFGKKAALLTTLGDLLKAIAAVLLARGLFIWLGVELALDSGYLAGLLVLIGHIYPIFFGFRGGKGVMPAVGIVLMVNPVVFGVMVAIALPLFLATRTMSLVSVISAASLPIVTLILSLLRKTPPLAATLFTLAYAILVIVSHRSNIKRLLSGSEKPIAPRSRK